MPRRGRRGKGGWLAFKKTDGPAGRALYLNQGDDGGGGGGGVAEPPERERPAIDLESRAPFFL